MIPSRTWFPASLAERAAWFANFSSKFGDLATHLGFLPADVTAVSNDNDVIQFAFIQGNDADDYADAARQYRKIVTEGNIGEPTPVWPAVPVPGATVPAVPTGIFERLDDLVKRIRVAPSYTDDDGVLLGINGKTPESTPPDQLQPSLKLKAMPGNVIEIDFVRAKSDGIEVQTKIDKEDNWSNAGRFFKSPAALTITANGQGLPRAVQVRARYLEGNNAVGQYSDIVETSTQP